MKVVLGVLAGLGVLAIVAMAAVAIIAGGATVTVVSDVEQGQLGAAEPSSGAPASLRITTKDAVLNCPIAGCCETRGGVAGIDIERGLAVCRDGEPDMACACAADAH